MKVALAEVQVLIVSFGIIQSNLKSLTLALTAKTQPRGNKVALVSKQKKHFASFFPLF